MERNNQEPVDSETEAQLNEHLRNYIFKIDPEEEKRHKEALKLKKAQREEILRE